MASELRPGERVVSGQGDGALHSLVLTVDRVCDQPYIYVRPRADERHQTGPQLLLRRAERLERYDPARHGPWRGPVLPVPPAVREALEELYRVAERERRHVENHFKREPIAANSDQAEVMAQGALGGDYYVALKKARAALAEIGEGRS